MPGPDAKAAPAGRRTGRAAARGRRADRAAAGAARSRDGRRARRVSTPPEGEMPADLDDDDMENNVSLAAMEAELKPEVLETFDTIADTYKKLRRLQDQDVDNA